MKTWKEVENSAAYKALTPAQKKAARRQYPHTKASVQTALEDIVKANADMAEQMVSAIEKIRAAAQESEVSNSKALESSLEAAVNSVNDRINKVEEALIQAMTWVQQGQSIDLKPLETLLGEKIDSIEFKQPNLSHVEQFMTDAGQTIEVINRKIRQINAPKQETHDYEIRIVERDLNDRIETARLIAIR